jgi:single-strand DNA-binding protein
MAGEAQIGFTGFVHKDPEIRFMNGGDAVATLVVKVTPFKRGPEGAKRGEPSWYRVSVWGKQGEAVADTVKEGDRVTVIGVVEMRTYEKDGQKRTGAEVRADSVGIVPKIENPTKTAASNESERAPW